LVTPCLLRVRHLKRFLHLIDLVLHARSSVVEIVQLDLIFDIRRLPLDLVKSASR
jgi:hypothetical protein